MKYVNNKSGFLFSMIIKDIIAFYDRIQLLNLLIYATIYMVSKPTKI